MWRDYFSEVKKLIEKVEVDERESIEQGARLIADVVMGGGVIHVFGSGHSHMLAEELFYRAGGLAAINPILIEEIMLHKGAARSSQLEQQGGWVEEQLSRFDIREGEVVIVASTSGRNPVPIEVALYAKQLGATVIAITSLLYANTQSSRYVSGQFLSEVADVVINNHIEVGDALLTDERNQVSFGSGSTVIGMMIVGGLVVEAVRLMIEAGFSPPIFKSNNAFDASEHNQQLLETYQKRIPMLATNIYKYYFNKKEEGM